MAGSLQTVSPISFESVSATTLTPSVQLGTKRSEGGIDYVYVYNGSTSSIGQGLMGNIGATSMNSGYTVTVTNAASQVGGPLVVGVAHNAAIPTLCYGWLATKGVVYGIPDATATSLNSGVEVTVGVDGGFVAVPVSMATGQTNASRLGFTINSFITTVGSGKILFKSPFYG